MTALSVVLDNLGELEKILECKHSDIIIKYNDNIRNFMDKKEPYKVAERVKFAYNYSKCYYGKNVYKTDTGITFVLYHDVLFGGDYTSQAIVCHKDHYKEVADYIHRSVFIESDKPLLEENLLEKVIDDTIGFHQSANKYRKYNIRLTKGIIFSGAPGNGKSMLCGYIRNLCHINHIPFFEITSSNIDEAHAKGTLEKLINKDGIMLFDDIDINYFDRSAGGRIACSLLSAMDGVNKKSDIVTIRIFTTNETISKMDPAFLRPGRIDKFYNFVAPNTDLRQSFIETWEPDVIKFINPAKAAKLTEGFSFAELSKLKTEIVRNKIIEKKDDDVYSLINNIKINKESDSRRIGFA